MRGNLPHYAIEEIAKTSAGILLSPGKGKARNKKVRHAPKQKRKKNR